MDIERFLGVRTVFGLRTTDRPRDATPTREAPPLSEVLEKAIRESGRTLEQPKKTKKNKRLLIASGLGGALALVGGTIWAVDSFTDNGSSLTPQPESIDSVGRTSFNDNRLIPRADADEKDVFDNTATTGVKSERNTIRMTREEYQKIAPPVINRENHNDIPVELNIPPGPDGRKTRKLTLEQGTSVNTLIYVKTPEGGIREVSYTKITNPGEVKGQNPIPIIFPNCKQFLGRKGEIQAGDILPAPISGSVYYRRGAGGDTGTDYFIEGEYYDTETGKKFKAIAQVHSLEAITKPLVENMPNEINYATKEKIKVTDDSGKEREIETATFSPLDKDKMPIVIVQQGESLFQFITKPHVQQFINAQKIESQILVTTSYIGDVEKNRYGEIFGGENCNHPTLDNKAVVLIQ